MAHHELLPGVDTCHWGYLDAALPPVLEIAPGDIVTIHTVSGGPGEIPPEWALVRPELRAIHAARTPAPGPHIRGGPIFVTGAEPGDALRIEILDIALRDDWGYNLSMPGKGALPDDFSEPSLRHLAIDRAHGMIRTPWGVEIPARPFFGFMGTAPEPAVGRLTSVIPGPFGGNIDNKELVAGTTLVLPVSVPGGLLSVGDGHAAQGDGEVNLTAVETGLTGTLRIDLVRGADLDAPEAGTRTHLIAMAFHEDLDEAVRVATRRAVRMVERRTGLEPEQAYALCSLVTDLRVTQVVNTRKGIHVMIPRQYLRPRQGAEA